MTSMREVKIEKVTLNCGCGTDHALLDKSVKLLELITGTKPVRTKSKVRLATWGLRKGLPIGTKVTVRGEDAKKLLARLVEAKEKTFKPTSFDDRGNISFGIQECIDIPGVEYKPEIGIIGLQVTITLQRPGYRVKSRKFLSSHIPHKHLVTRDAAVEFMKKEYDNGFVSDQEEDE